MNPFPAALDLVHSTLRDLRESGAELRADADSLARLAANRRAGAPPAPRATEAVALHSEKPAPREPRPFSKVEPPRAEPPPAVSPARSDFARIPVPAGASKSEQLAAMQGPALICTRCPHLAATRTQVVFGIGNPEAELMFVGDAPGADEDLEGEPFVGKAGQLLTKIIVAMGFDRSQIYLANVLKCRPDMPVGDSGNRKPTKSEMATCLPYLQQQIEIIQPRVLVALGAVAMEGLLGETQPMARLRGRWHEFGGIPLMATFHPAYLLHNQSLTEKRKVWEDMLLVLEKLARPISEKQRNFFSKAG